MREFGPSIDAATRAKIAAAAQQLFDRVEPKRAVRASEFAMTENPEMVVVHEAEIRWEGGRLRIAATEPAVRPPFEWLLEITSDIGDADYYKHYLVREDDIVLAQRKVLTLIDEPEAELILHDLAVASEHVVTSDL